MHAARPWAFGLFRAGALLLPALAAALWGWIAWHDALRSATRHAEAQAELVAQYMERMIQTQEVLHHAVRARARTLASSEVGGIGFHRFLAELDGGQAFGQGILVLGLDRRVAASSRRYPVDVVIGPRAYVDAIVGGAPLFVDRIRLMPTGEDAMVVASPLGVAGFEGLVVSGFPADAVSAFLRRIAARPNEAASVLRTDGMLLIRNFIAEPVMLPPTAPGRVHPEKSRTGSFIATALTDGIRRIYAFHHVDDMPLIANFGVPLAVVWHDWSARAVPMFAFLGLTALFGYAAVVRMRRDIEARFTAEANLKRVEAAERLAEERIRLMRETNHRVKNNLALVVSLINFQMRGKSGINGAELKTRIGAISHVHDLMYQAADGVHLDLGALLNDIATSQALVPTESGIAVRCEIEPGIILGPDRTTPLALITAELLTNVVKHAWRDGEAGEVRVSLHRDGAEAVLTVEDDGRGLPAEGSRRSGSAIVEALVEQIGARLTRSTKEGGVGARFSLRFPV